MDKKLKAKWVKALRSGKYTQCVGALFDKASETYCCLGVLTKVARRKLDNTQWDFVQKTLKRDVMNLLWKMNDGVEGQRKHSFPEIADYIEAKL